MTLDPIRWNQHALANKLQTLILLVSMGCLMLFVGYLLWGAKGALMLAIAGCLLIMFTPKLAPQLIMMMYRASPMPRAQAPFIHDAVYELSRRAGLRVIPNIYYIPSSTLNAFSVGRPDDAGVGLTDGILHTLDASDLIAVLAHEISHIRNNDIRVMALADLFSRLTSFMSLFGQIMLFINIPLLIVGDVTFNWLAVLLLILSPNFCALAQLGLSRTREYDADLNASRLTGDPEGLARALIKIENAQKSWFEWVLLPGHKQSEPSLLRTHPPTGERVQRLMKLRHTHNRDTPFPRTGREDMSHRFITERVERRPRRHIGGLWH